MAINTSAKVITQKTPTGTNSNVIATRYANGNWNIQKQIKLIYVGVLVSPVPLNEA